ncbi:MAG: CoA transferase [Pseudomonadota bacterium]
MDTSFTRFLKEIRGAMPVCENSPPRVATNDSPHGLPSVFNVTEFACATMGAALGELAALSGSTETVELSRVLASRWFGMTLHPDGWELPPTWDAIAGDYRAEDRWIRLHTNAPHHRDAALSVLRCSADRDVVTETVRQWDAVELESAIVAAGGCAAAMLSPEEWSKHPNGLQVSKDPLIEWSQRSELSSEREPTTQPVDAERPLKGLKVLDCTRVLAGPVCTRLLAGYGAQVLRIDPPDWDEGVVVPEVTLGKRLATLDLRDAKQKERFASLLKEADVFVHGYRPGALEGLDLGAEVRRDLNPRLIDVSLCAYGLSGPWRDRRGFDSLVQMSSGIAHAGMTVTGAEKPTPLPVQALDHGTGYLMAASVIRALRLKRESGVVFRARLSLARTAALLTSTGPHPVRQSMPEEASDERATHAEQTSWGSAYRTRFPVISGMAQPDWPLPARRYHSDPPIFA